ncbi:GIY-YIG nuclease family protein [Herbiconiux sp. L3-i23]|uniref:GIY-YIG nuclease family protein n=1 Tax=Herbiconiux sp. L3-i23 TaxID=2905871 RepID=UPI0020538D84|nr:GIY-YIG nuclease family protein [Herbiconiux sp. L3-i23]BDI22931.1 hypothetical protein L3i23_17070 [Herbiconiux sp. L3-i23]
MAEPSSNALAAPCFFCRGERGVRVDGRLRCATCDWRVGDVIDHELPPPRVDVVYYLRYRDRVKIGTTANPRQRFAAIRFDSLLAFELGDRHREHERHLEFADARLERSEWFDLTPTLAKHIERLRSDGDDPWLVHLRWTSAAYAAQL